VIRVLLFTLLFASVANAQDVEDPPCACVAQGKRWAQGERICIKGKVLTCGMSGNLSTWVPSQEACLPRTVRSVSKRSLKSAFKKTDAVFSVHREKSPKA
jgi:hypothetical protein